MKTCSLEGCDRKHYGLGMCRSHWDKSRRVRIPKERLTLEQRFLAKVNKTDTCWLWTGSKSVGRRAGYGELRVGDKVKKAHRVSYELYVGPIPEGMMLDHICHTPACVNPTHLRPCTNKQNGENKPVLACHNTSGARGVTWNKRSKRWVAQVHHLGRCYFLGRFLTFEEAEAAAIAKRNELYTHNDIDRMVAA